MRISKHILIAALVIAMAITSLLLGRAVAGEPVTLTGERLQAYRLGMHQAVDDVEKECTQRGRFQVQVGTVTRTYRCSPDWI